MNIIFLDVDGPLIPGRMYYNKPHSTRHDNGFFRWDPIAVDMIFTLAKRCQAEVVFNTSHNEEDKKLMIEACHHNGMPDWILHESVRTGFRVESYSKKDSIVQWLRDHPEVVNWVVIDDEEIMPSNQVKVDFNAGMSIDNFYQVEAWLQGKQPEISKKLII